jgi:hypothetical protein
MAGAAAKADSSSCFNGLNDVRNRHDALTILAHIGYLGFTPTEWSEGQAFIPNWEAARQFEAAVRSACLPGVTEPIRNSKEILEATWRLDGAFVAEKLDKVRALKTSVLGDDDDSSLASLICLAYFAAKELYLVFRELSSGRCLAVFPPKRRLSRKAGPAGRMEMGRVARVGRLGHRPNKAKTLSTSVGGLRRKASFGGD